MSIASAVRTIARGECYETGGDTWRLWLGDLAWWNENEGGYREGPKFILEIGCDHIGEYDTTPRRLLEDRREYLSLWITVHIWRWGFTFNRRGREITGTDWDIPRWKLDKYGKLLPEWAD